MVRKTSLTTLSLTGNTHISSSMLSTIEEFVDANKAQSVVDPMVCPTPNPPTPGTAVSLLPGNCTPDPECSNDDAKWNSLPDHGAELEIDIRDMSKERCNLTRNCGGTATDG
jgi:hypothetical protein